MEEKTLETVEEKVLSKDNLIEHDNQQVELLNDTKSLYKNLKDSPPNIDISK